MDAGHATLRGNTRTQREGAERIGDVDPDAAVQVTVTVRGVPLPKTGRTLTPEQLRDKYAPRSEDVKKVKKGLKRFGLVVESESPDTGSLIVGGTAAQMEAAFQPRLGLYRSAEDGEFRGRGDKLKVPSELQGLLSAVVGLDQRRVARRLPKTRATPAPAASPRTVRALGPAAVEKRYSFPPGGASGQTIAIAEFGGGYFPDDVQKFCQNHRRPVPDVEIVSIGAPPLTPADIDRLPTGQQQQKLGESREVMMDVEIVAGLCSDAKICVFFSSFDQKGWIDLLDQVIAMKPAPVAVCMSWGMAEDASDWSLAARDAINRRLHHASLLGITVCAAAGDDGSGDEMHDGRAHVHFPASSPFVLSVGGTMLDGEQEVVWWNHPGDRSVRRGGATGGGVSVEFNRPAWQNVSVRSLNAGTIDGRIVPDVAALAGLPAYSFVFNGRSTRGGGTSAATPLWASLIARIAAETPDRSPAFLAPLLYEPGPSGHVRGKQAFADVTRGDNKSPQLGLGYRARRGYDAVTGWGVPNGRALLESLQGRPTRHR